MDRILLLKFKPNSCNVHWWEYRPGNLYEYWNKVILLQHGLLDSSHAWTMNLKNQSLAYILADNDYDVWLGNSRGSTYSKKHQRFDSSQAEFWDFTWQEMSNYDFPATIQYILSITKVERLTYVGFSQTRNAILNETS
ncbi:unnamed protein product [Trichobilharzia regenti]|nr:unnamed protein product [Trichobilharzia regenti]